MTYRVPKTLFAVTIAAILLGNAFVLYTLHSRRLARSEEAEEREVIRQLDAIQALLVDAETGQRGYVLTGKPEYLEPFNAANEKVLPAISALADRSKTSSVPLEGLDTLRAHATAKLQELKATIALYDSGHKDETEKVIASGVGKQEMDIVRATVARMKELQTAKVASTRNRWETLLRWMYASVICFSVLALVTTVTLVREVATRSDLSARIETVDEIAHELNNPLQATTNLFGLLKLKEPLPDEVRDFLRMLESEHNRIAELSRRILTRTKKAG